jgi:hypothetical protein
VAQQDPALAREPPNVSRQPTMHLVHDRGDATDDVWA